MYVIDGREFDWDENKHEANIKKHGVDFYEAASVIFKPGSIISYDHQHSDFEERYRAIGFSEQSRILMVCHCYRNGEVVTRIFSARKATKQEHDDYWRERNERGY